MKPADPNLVGYLFEVRNLVTERTFATWAKRRGQPAWEDRGLPTSVDPLKPVADQVSRIQVQLYLNGNIPEALRLMRKLELEPLATFLKQEKTSVGFKEAKTLVDEFLLDVDTVSRLHFGRVDRQYLELNRLYGKFNALKPKS